MARLGTQAIVIGSGMGGLMAARTLSDFFDSVLIVERDTFPGGDVPRKGAPQGRHAHGLLATGRQTLETMFPGFGPELLARGGILGDVGADVIWSNYGVALASPKSGLDSFLISRPALENAVRTRVAQVPNVTLRSGCDAVELSCDRAKERVTGVVVRNTAANAAEERIAADLVVDSGGRGARTPTWLERLGYPKPTEETIKVEINYTTRHYHVPPAHSPGRIAAVISPCAPLWRGAAALRQEGDRWVVTLFGYFADRAPPDAEGFREFARTLPHPFAYEVLRNAEPIDEAAVYRFPASLRRRYDKLARFPEGYLAFGDALCSFNPIYGQGMSVAAMEARALGDCLAKGSADLRKRFFPAASAIIDAPWQIAAGADLANPSVEGARPLQVRFINWYVEKLFRAGSRDPLLANVFLRVANLVSPPTELLSPKVAWRVFRARGGRLDSVQTAAAQ